MGRRKSPGVQSEESAEGGGPQPADVHADSGALVPAHATIDHPTAVQTLDRRGRALRYAYCPEHGRGSRRYVGTTAAGWVFFCAVGPHRFTAPPDPTGPKTVYEAQAAAAWAVANPHN